MGEHLANIDGTQHASKETCHVRVDNPCHFECHVKHYFGECDHSCDRTRPVWHHVGTLQPWQSLCRRVPGWHGRMVRVLQRPQHTPQSTHQHSIKVRMTVLCI